MKKCEIKQSRSSLEKPIPQTDKTPQGSAPSLTQDLEESRAKFERWHLHGRIQGCNTAKDP